MQTAFLVNGATLDFAPTHVMRARTVPVQRQLAAHRWLLRRKADGKFLACASIHDSRVEWTWLVRADAKWRIEADALAKQARPRGLGNAGRRAYCATRGEFLQQARDSRLSDATGPEYVQRTGLDRVREPLLLGYAGLDRYRRPLWLDAPAAFAWARMCSTAAREAVVLEAISGFRSRAYQVGIFNRKLARGQSIDEILTVNAAPGFSEHHSGRALDIGTPGEPPAEESFEGTPAFDWLTNNAQRFGFAMSYPRGNPHGIAYEPWHWMWHPPRASGSAKRTHAS